MPDAPVWISAVRDSHDRYANLLEPLDAATVRGRAYPSEWTIAQVASHLGSQAEIFELFLEAGLAGTPAPGSEQFGPIWGEWNVRTAPQQVSGSIAADEQFVSHLEALTDDDVNRFSLDAFGRQLDLRGLLVMRLGEHAVHTWDIEVALDPSVAVAPGAMELLVDTLPAMAARVGKSGENAREIRVETTDPARRFVLAIGSEVTLTADDGDGPADLILPAEALLRLIYGRLDPEHTPNGITGAEILDGLRPVFPGF